jgi:hypothetical protein
MLPNTNFYNVQSDVLYDYETMFYRFYKPFKPGTVTRNHVFWVEAATPTVMRTKLFDSCEDVVLFVFAPDSGTGPTDEVNPLKIRTYIGQQRYAR